MSAKIMPLAAAEALQQFGVELDRLLRDLDWVCKNADAATVDAVNAIPDQDKLDTIAARFREVGAELIERHTIRPGPVSTCIEHQDGGPTLRLSYQIKVF